MVRDAGSVALTNDTEPDFQRLPEGDRADMDYFVEQVRIVLPVLGLDIFRQRTVQSNARGEAKDQDDVTFTFATAGASARAQETDEGFVVLAGSTARKQPSGTFPAGYLALRTSLLADGRLIEGPTPDLYQLAIDVAFSSPSAAASIIAARSASGPLEWKVGSTGQAYRDWRAARLED